MSCYFSVPLAEEGHKGGITGEYVVGDTWTFRLLSRLQQFGRRWFKGRSLIVSHTINDVNEKAVSSHWKRGEFAGVDVEIIRIPALNLEFLKVVARVYFDKPPITMRNHRIIKADGTVVYVNGGKSGVDDGHARRESASATHDVGGNVPIGNSDKSELAIPSQVISDSKSSSNDSGQTDKPLPDQA